MRKIDIEEQENIELIIKIKCGIMFQESERRGLVMQVILIILGYFLIMNVIGFVIMGMDKWRAKRRAWRIPEATLFAVCIFGGSIGSTLGMFSFRHKTKHWYFRYGFPAIMVIHFILIIIAIGSGKLLIM